MEKNLCPGRAAFKTPLYIRGLILYFVETLLHAGVAVHVVK